MRRRTGLADLDLRTQTGEIPTPAFAAQGLPCLTIAYHPQFDRIGELALLPQLDGRSPVDVSRSTPGFVVPGTDDPAPLGERFVSRNPIQLRGDSNGGVVVGRAADGMHVAVNGVEVALKRTVTAAEIKQGATITVARRVVLLLHRRRPPHAKPDALGIIGGSDAIERVRERIRHVADLEVSVLVRGETGTGKELVAQAVHRLSRRAGALLAVNLSAIPATLVASELFGHARGAFSGADRPRAGYFEEADRGSLFLDEIGDAPSDVQVMLLRTLETGEVRRVGASEATSVDVRVIAATDANLEQAVASGRFREPLLHRLAGYEIEVPTLRERPDDVGRLMVHFLTEELAKIGESQRLTDPPGKVLWLPADVVEPLCRHPWSGNVRQLRNVVRQMVISGRGSTHVTLDGPLKRLLEASGTKPGDATAAAPPAGADSATATSPAPQEALTETRLRQVLVAHRYGIQKTASALGLSKNALYAALAEFGIRSAREIPETEITLVLAKCDGCTNATAETLQVSERALKLRMRSLGLT